MLGTYFYHEITRKTVIAFGTLFNDIYVRHEDGAGNDFLTEADEIKNQKIEIESVMLMNSLVQKISDCLRGGR